MNKFTFDYKNRLLKEAEHDPQKAMTDLKDVYDIYGGTFDSRYHNLEKANYEQAFELITRLKTFGAVCHDTVKYNTTGYSDGQVEAVLNGYKDQFSASDYVDFDSTTMAVSKPSAEQVKVAIEEIYHSFDPCNYAVNMLRLPISYLGNVSKCYQYQIAQAEQIAEMVGGFVHADSNKSAYMAKARGVLNSYKFGQEVAENHKKFDNHGKNWEKTLDILRFVSTKVYIERATCRKWLLKPKNNEN